MVGFNTCGNWEKGLFFLRETLERNDKEAIVETISSGYETVKHYIQEIAEPIKAHHILPKAIEKENPELRKYDVKTHRKKISRTVIEQFPRAGEDLDIKRKP
jgi:hypothetical protein